MNPSILRWLLKANLIFGAIALVLVLIAGIMMLQSCSTPPKQYTTKPKHDKKIVVMVIDTGIDYTHPELARFIPNEYKAPIYNDYHKHGTHVAGLITHDACPEVQIIPCPAYPEFNPYLDQSKSAMQYELDCYRKAIELNVDIINQSGGGEETSDQERAIMTELEQHHIALIASAGNEHSDLQVKKFYPASYHTEFNNIIAVMSVDNSGDRSPTSNWGSGLAEERGDVIFSTLPHNSHGYMSGTSQAAANYTNKVIKNLCADRHD